MVRDDPNLYLVPKLSDIPWHFGQECVVLVGASTVEGKIGYSVVISTVCSREELPKFRLRAATRIVHDIDGIPVEMERRATVDLISIKENDFFVGMYMLEFNVHP